MEGQSFEVIGDQGRLEIKRARGVQTLVERNRFLRIDAGIDKVNTRF
jgi:hypothetical protein